MLENLLFGDASSSGKENATTPDNLFHLKKAKCGVSSVMYLKKRTIQVNKIWVKYVEGMKKWRCSIFREVMCGYHTERKKHFIKK